jgi:anti-sigma factor RsiW
MIECILSRKVHAYFDGELDESARRQVEAHIEACESCRRELDDLRRLREFIAASSLPALSVNAMTRLHQHVASIADRTVRRTASLLTAAAVVLLVTGGVMSWRISQTVSPGDWAEKWEEAAFNLRDQPSELDDAESEFAQRMVAMVTLERNND